MLISRQRELDLVVERLEGARFVLLRRVGIERRARRSTSRRPVETHASLTPGEERVLALVGDGLHSAEIASHLGLAKTTIDDTIESARGKLGARTRIQAAVIARTRSAIPPEEVAAILAAIRGSSLLVSIIDERSQNRFIADLTHLDPDRRLTAARDVGTLHPEAAALLAGLAEGDSIESAARRVGLSRRTAHRRLARARSVLGVRSNAAAVARFSSLEPN